MALPEERRRSILPKGIDEPERRRGVAAIRNEKRLHEILEGLGLSSWVGVITTDGRLTYANRAALDAIGATPADILDKPFEDTPWWSFSQAERVRLRAAIEAGAAGSMSRFEVPVRVRDGHILTIDCALQPIFDRSGRVAYLVASGYDVTERKLAEHELRLTQFAVDHADDAMFRVNPEGFICYVNDAACRALGYSRDELLRKSVHDIDFQLNKADWPAWWEKLRAQGSDRFESTHRRCDGREVPVEISATYFEYEGEQYSFANVRDISDRKAAEKRIRYLANYDELTGLPNRTLLRERLNQTIQFASKYELPVKVLYIDLDRFHVVNDTFGLAHGDHVLRVAAARIRAAVQDVDTVARIESDEFVAVLAGEEIPKDRVSRAGQRIQDALTGPVDIEGQEIWITCSIGVAMYPTDGTDADELLRNAASALHVAKAQGGDIPHVYSPDRVRDPEVLSLEVALHKALSNGDFQLHYQPRMNVNSGKVLGVEALLRWQHPEKGLIPPSRFIPVAEATGVILPIGEWVLRTACVQRKVWSEEGLAVGRVAVNLSARQFRQRNLMRDLAVLLSQARLDPQLLEIELTESMLMQDVDAAIQILTELRELGVRVALDDFGTGYSSLSYLKRFPIDALKIDQSFVREITSDKSSAAIAEAIIVMAHRLQLDAIAEGVETEAQLTILRDGGCDEVQGFLLCKPLPPGELTEFLRARAPWGTSSN